MKLPTLDQSARDYIEAEGGPTEHAKKRSDLGNARRLVARHGDRFRYVYDGGRWLHYDGSRWADDFTGEIHRAAKETVEEIFVEAQNVHDEGQRASLRKFALASQNSARIRNMIDLARTELPLTISASKLDVDPWDLNVANGTVDLRAGTLRPHDRDDLISKLVPVVYDPDAKCPTWEAFLDRIMNGNVEMVRFLRRAIGYSLTGQVVEQVFFLLYGTGANGKSTFVSVIERVLGDYAMHTPTETLMVRRSDGIPNDVARLRAARFVSAVEGEHGQKLGEARIKQLTGGDSVTARFLNHEFFTFRPTFKLWLATNHKPRVGGTDLAIWRRIKFIPFTVTIPEEERDPRMLEKLLTEAPGILTWAIAGCLEWQKQGLAVPEEIKRATEAYRVEEDALAPFLADCCEMDPDTWTPFAKLYRAYTNWCERVGEKKPMSRKSFSAALDERAIESDPTKRDRPRKGLRVLTEIEMQR